MSNNIVVPLTITLELEPAAIAAIAASFGENGDGDDPKVALADLLLAVSEDNLGPVRDAAEALFNAALPNDLTIAGLPDCRLIARGPLES